MSVKKTTFKKRIRKNDMKQRHQIGANLRKRMGAARRVHNRNDLVDDSARPMAMIVSDIAEGTAMPVQEAILDPRALTDMLLRPAPPAAAAAATPIVTVTATSSSSTNSSGSKNRKAAVSAPQLAAARILPSAPLAADDPLALPDASIYEEEERQQRLARAAAGLQKENKNLYKHSGQAYLFWERVGLHPALLKALRDLHFTHPTPVQEEVLPNVLAHDNEELAKHLKGQGEKKNKKHKRSGAQHGAQDVVVSAETGSGKTLVFALPILQDLLMKMERDGVTIGVPASEDNKAVASESADDAQMPTSAPAATLPRETRQQRRTRIMHSLIVSPTRELALQIHAAIRQLTKFTPQVVVGCVVGGMAQERQQRVLNRHPHILICTPGRLWDLVQKNEGCYLGHSISRRLHYVVLDEADKMLQSGRFDELQTLLERIHCEVLPAGFVQDREEGAEAGDVEVESGRWDAETQQFVPFTREEAAAHKTQKEEPTATAPSAKATRKTTKRSREDVEVEESHETTPKGSLGGKKTKSKSVTEGGDDARKMKKAKRAKKVGMEFGDELDVAADANAAVAMGNEEEEEGEEESGEARRRKDEPQPIPMPPEPAAEHRVVTFVTSATLSLQTNYERRDYSARKSVIRTSNVDVLNKVLQQLEIKPSNAQVFSLTESANVATRINETYLRCPDNSKDLYLYYFLKTYSDDRAIVFVNAISMLRRLVKLLEVLGIAVVGLHASMQQRQRLKFIDKFKTGDIRVLVATDVASRGLDVDGLKYVVHYQVPRTTDAYIHRCGRTARCGGTGLSMLLVNAQEHMSFRKLMESLGRRESEIETFAVQPTVVHQLSSHLRIALQIDKLQKEIGKSQASNRWVSRMTKEADIETDDMYDDTVDSENRQKQKAIRILQRELQLLTKKFTGQFGGKGAFRTSAYALGAKEAEQKLKERADRQTIRAGAKTKKGTKGSRK
ncbi:Atp-dependent RNA helicase-like protein [Leptomonas pyrrhocoris]|uniref:ATP-dependent RNA helicase n=1 Tax=Leptomonas pyrrhocoris TaxID=157538 RepID=A0A0M9G3H8_LEPPY|nr:Atp-dependent RNA helicase-like protein [Leptomonas pyrrhocoris]KPA81493.1 Atp-dependent RNA helicase-like protein [Leptomonas pyrrhocoris]|eukprot:XP_015659932.1 Atp-dependent RNA helicase-like protein [Leptomonas pyrrhocoris]